MDAKCVVLGGTFFGYPLRKKVVVFDSACAQTKDNHSCKYFYSFDVSKKFKKRTSIMAVFN